jgi:hypothetical protein
MKTTETAEEVSSHPGEKRRWEHKKVSEHPLCQRITGMDWKKVLANLWNRKRIAKKANAGHGLEIKWEIPVHIKPTRKPISL